MNARKFVPQKHFVDRFPSFSTTEGCHRSIFLCMLETSKRRGGFQNESNNHRQLYAQILDLLRRTQELERQKGILYGLVLIVLGIACGAISKTTGGTDVQDFVSGVLMGLSVAEILAGIGIIGKRVIHK